MVQVIEVGPSMLPGDDGLLHIPRLQPSQQVLWAHSPPGQPGAGASGPEPALPSERVQAERAAAFDVCSRLIAPRIPDRPIAR